MSKLKPDSMTSKFRPGNQSMYQCTIYKNNNVVKIKNVSFNWWSGFGDFLNLESPGFNTILLYIIY